MAIPNTERTRTSPKYRASTAPIHFVMILRLTDFHPNHKTIAQTAQTTMNMGGELVVVPSAYKRRSRIQTTIGSAPQTKRSTKLETRPLPSFDPSRLFIAALYAEVGQYSTANAQYLLKAGDPMFRRLWVNSDGDLSPAVVKCYRLSDYLRLARRFHRGTAHGAGARIRQSCVAFGMAEQESRRTPDT